MTRSKDAASHADRQRGSGSSEPSAAGGDQLRGPDPLAVRSSHGSPLWFVIAIAAIGLLAFAVVLGSGVAAVRHVASSQAVEHARALTQVHAREVGLRITDSMVNGSDPEARTRLASMLEQVVDPHPGGPVVRVKLWKAEAGTAEIVCSDLPALIGLREKLDQEQNAVLRTGAVRATTADLERDEERTERGLGPLTEVYTRIVTPKGRPLLFETYQTSEEILVSAEEIAAEFTPVIVRTLVAAVALELLLAAILIRRQHALMAKAIDASDRERLKIAGELHDGPIQEIAGLCMRLDTQAQAETDEHVRGRLQQVAATGRDTLRSLHSAVVGLHPHNLDQVGLQAALSDVLARLPANRFRGHLDYRVTGRLDVKTSELLYRTSQEAIRSVEKHMAAANVWISVQHQNDLVFLSVHYDGGGAAAIDPQITTSERFGLALLADIIRDAGGRIHVTATSTSTTLTVQIPA